MACTTVTVQAPQVAKPVVSNVVATPRAAQQGYVDITWSQDIAGAITITVDGTIPAGWNQYDTTRRAGTAAYLVTGLSVGAHTICVEAT